MSINLKNSEIVKKYGKDEALHQLIENLSKPNHKDTRVAWLKELKQNYKEVYDELLYQYSVNSPELIKTFLKKLIIPLKK
ncbi:MAG: hypothetical protein QG630_115 [Patescibacteria group bacterium]|nr:hypothetical protein [Patescibacteria group bacterium]